MINRFRSWLAGWLAPTSIQPPASALPDAPLAAKYAAAVETFNLQLGANMAIQADLLRQLNEITALLTAASVRLANQDAAVRQRIADLTATITEQQAENQRLRDAAESGAASSIEIAAALAALAEAAKRLGAPSEAGAPGEATA